MKIDLKEITIAELTEGYQDNLEDGVIGLGGKLNIRPPFQREFVYNDSQCQAVIDTVLKNFPLNVMYFAVNDNGNYELIDGQQRTLSICQYVNGDFAYICRYFHSLQEDEKKQILNYKIMVYICDGKDSEKLEWFKTINIAGEKLTEQELKNATYSGPWVTDAKRYFSKNDCAAYKIANRYLNGTAIRQDYLETCLKWISSTQTTDQKPNIANYMSVHSNYDNASELWQYFQAVISWVERTFPKYRREMKGIDWGFLYNKFKDAKLNAQKLEEEISKLMQDDDVTAKKGIYWYVLTREEKHLNIRSFTESQKRTAYERQNGKCAKSGVKLDISEMEADHITPWHLGGKTEIDNLQMISKAENRKKSGK